MNKTNWSTARRSRTPIVNLTQGFIQATNATLEVINYGPALQAGDMFTVFNQPVQMATGETFKFVSPGVTFTDNQDETVTVAYRRHADGATTHRGGFGRAVEPVVAVHLDGLARAGPDQHAGKGLGHQLVQHSGNRPEQQLLGHDEQGKQFGVLSSGAVKARELMVELGTGGTFPVCKSGEDAIQNVITALRKSQAAMRMGKGKSEQFVAKRKARQRINEVSRQIR